MCIRDRCKDDVISIPSVSVRPTPSSVRGSGLVSLSVECLPSEELKWRKLLSSQYLTGPWREPLHEIVSMRGEGRAGRGQSSHGGH